MPLSLKRYCRLLSVSAEEPPLALDDARVRRRSRQDERLGELIREERRRLGSLQKHERRARRDGFLRVAGVDEVGRGPLAGPLVAAAVVFERSPQIPVLDDSKKLTPEEREALFELIRARAADVGLGFVTVEELNASDMHRSSLLAMGRAVAALTAAPDCVLVDGRHPIPELACAQRTLVGGDALSLSIAAASVIAKVTRDRYMEEMDAVYPQYGFRHHKGYPTAEHRAALRRVGASPIHRVRFQPVAASRVEDDRQLELF